jgi:hypothetical protein
MKVHGIELQVGEKPPDLYSSTLLAFNDAFLRMFEAFEKNPKGRAILTFHGKHEESMGLDGYGENSFGYLLLSKVWKTLAYNQMVTTKKQRESYEEYGQQKKRTLTIVEPTSLGIYVYENGQLLTVYQRWTEQEIKIGIGKPYTTHRELWERIERMAKIGGVAKTRIEKWRYEFKSYCVENLLDKKRDEAEELAIKFGREHIANAPTRFGRRNKIKHANDEVLMKIGETVVVKKPNHSLLDYQ